MPGTRKLKGKEEMIDARKGPLIYEERVAKGLRPNRFTIGWRWKFWEDLGRALWIGLLF